MGAKVAMIGLDGNQNSVDERDIPAVSSIYMRIIVNILIFFVFITAVSFAETAVGTYNSREAAFRLVEIVSGLSHPWAVAFLPGGDLLVTERTGKLKRISGGDISTISGMPRVAAIRQGGLLDVALHPFFEENRLVYFSYSAGNATGYGTHIGRGRLVDDELHDFEIIFKMSALTRTTHHFGSRLAFAKDGTLIFSIGDRGDRARAQNLGDHAGKVLRINDDGSIPADNPFVGIIGALPEVYTYGHRNVQGLAIDPASGAVWAHEHGPKGGDEVNIIRGGANYGWPEITYGREYSGGYIAPVEKPGLEQPIIHWTPSIAPSGLALYTSDRIPGWKGNLFAGALAGQHLRRLVVDGLDIVEQDVLLKKDVGRIRDVRQGPDGDLWILIDAPRGSIYRIEAAD